MSLAHPGQPLPLGGVSDVTSSSRCSAYRPSWKERCFQTEGVVDQLVFHYSVEGSILLKDSDEARYQEEYWDEKKNHDNMLLNKINKAIKEGGVKYKRKYYIFETLAGWRFKYFFERANF